MEKEFLVSGLFSINNKKNKIIKGKIHFIFDEKFDNPEMYYYLINTSSLHVLIFGLSLKIILHDKIIFQKDIITEKRVMMPGSIIDDYLDLREHKDNEDLRACIENHSKKSPIYISILNFDKHIDEEQQVIFSEIKFNRKKNNKWIEDQDY